jgi:tellurite resistance protein
MVVFRQDTQDSVRSPSGEYVTATLLVHLATLVAAADGTVDAAEIQALDARIEQASGLSANERARLRAHARWLIAIGPRVNGLKKRLSSLSEPARKLIGRFALSMAQADGRIDAAEVDTLRKVYGMLDLPSHEVFAELATKQQLEAAAQGPVVVRPAKASSAGYAIPAPQAKTPQAAPLVDMDVVRRKLEETAQVSSLLSAIFAEDDAPEGAPERPAAVAEASGAGIVGLDAAQTRFVQALLAAGEWEQSQVEALAEHHSVLLDGTIEAVNELAFDHAGEPAIEWSEPVEVNVSLIKELFV